MNNGYILLHRSLLDWEWYSNANTSRVFIHCLLKANWTDGRFEGIEVPRGSFVSSYGAMAEELNMSLQNVRTAISHLISTCELTSKGHAKFTVFTVVNYDSYQIQLTRSLTINQQTTNKQLTTIEESNKGNKGNKSSILTYMDIRGFDERFKEGTDGGKVFKDS